MNKEKRSVLLENAKSHIDKQRLMYCFVLTFVIGLICHAYAYLNYQPSHDSLYEAVSNSDYWEMKIEYGRYIKPLCDMVLGKFASFPWINGLISLFWLSLSAYIVTDIFKIERRRDIGLFCGILTTNITVISMSATYFQDLSANMFALFLSLVGTHIWFDMTNRYDDLGVKKKILLSFAAALCLFVSMGIYQAFVSVFITLVLIISIMRLLNEEAESKKVWTGDFWGAGSVIAGGVLYYGIYKLVLLVTGIEMNTQNYNSLAQLFSSELSVGELLTQTFGYVFKYIFTAPYYTYPTYVTSAISIAIFAAMVICFIIAVRNLRKNKAKKSTRISVVFFFLMIPFAMNIVNLMGGVTHAVMIYSFWFTYIIAILFTKHFTKIKSRMFFEKATALLLCCLIFANIQVANAAYVKKTTEQQATLSVMTRVLARIESIDGYEPGVTPVAFMGVPNKYLTEYEEFEDQIFITGLGYTSAITYPNIYKKYFSMILKVDINVVKNKEAVEIYDKNNLADMPTFPDNDSIKVIDGTVVVKFSDRKDRSSTEKNDESNS